MLSKNKLKYVRSLKHKKYRDKHRQFVVEGDKIIMDLLGQDFKPGSAFAPGLDIKPAGEIKPGQGLRQIDQLIATSAWLKKNLPKHAERINEIIEVSEKEYDQMTMLEHPSGVMAVMHMPEPRTADEMLPSGISLVLETIQDPGNLGTIIRTASWFGLQTIYCSPDCVDCYNPKVVQSSMGAILDMPVCYTPLPELLKEYNKSACHTVYGTYMTGSPIWNADLDKNAIIVLGNESRGISDGLMPYISSRLHIPKHERSGDSATQVHTASLNVAAAAAIVCAAFRMPSLH
jgi:TrmH family RNA methyltransferase